MKKWGKLTVFILPELKNSETIKWRLSLYPLLIAFSPPRGSIEGSEEDLKEEVLGVLRGKVIRDLQEEQSVIRKCLRTTPVT